MRSCVVIVNPKAGRGGAMDHVQRAFEGIPLDVSIEPTVRPGHGSELAAHARGRGADLVVAAGGDGTVHEVVNGLLADGPVEDLPALGVLPLGSGCDYAKTFAIPERIDDAVALLTAERQPRSVDVGEVTFAEGSRYFVNISEVGIGPETVARAAKLPRALGGAMYGVAFLSILPGFRRREARIAIDGRDDYDGPLIELVAAIGQVFGGGMRVAPEADPSDGLFDVQIHFGTKVDYVRGLPKVYKGTHIPHPRIREERSAHLVVTCDPVGLVEADGEVLGHTPATYRLLPGALKLKV